MRLVASLDGGFPTSPTWHWWCLRATLMTSNRISKPRSGFLEGNVATPLSLAIDSSCTASRTSNQVVRRKIKFGDSLGDDGVNAITCDLWYVRIIPTTSNRYSKRRSQVPRR